MSAPVESGSRRRIPFWLLIVAAVGSAALLVVSILGWGHGGTATLRAIAASETMSDPQARAVAESTVLVWNRELRARNLANLLELTCPDLTPNSALAHEIEDVRKRLPAGRELQVVTFGSFVRDGPRWRLNVFFDGPGLLFEFRIVDGGLRVCELASAPVP